MKNEKFKPVVIVTVMLITILSNFFCPSQHRLQERKAGMPIYLRVRSSSSPRNRKIEESSQSLHRLFRMLQKNLDSVQVQFAKSNKEYKSGFLSKMTATTMGTCDELVSSHNFFGGAK